MKAEDFIKKYKSIDSIDSSYRFYTDYTTDNKDYIWREDNTKVDPEAHYVMMQRGKNNKLKLSIGLDAPNDPFYDEENFYQEITTYFQENESDEEFYNNCINTINSDNLILDDNYYIDNKKDESIVRCPIIFN